MIILEGPGWFTAEFGQFSSAWEDDEAYFSITQHRELTSLLQKPSSAFRKSDLPVCSALDPRNLYLSPSHYLYQQLIL